MRQWRRGGRRRPARERQENTSLMTRPSAKKQIRGEICLLPNRDVNPVSLLYIGSRLLEALLKVKGPGYEHHAFTVAQKAHVELGKGKTTHI